MLTLPLVNVHAVGSSASIPLSPVVASTNAVVSKWKASLPANLPFAQIQLRVWDQRRLPPHLQY